MTRPNRWQPRFVYGENKATTPDLVLMGGGVYRVIADHLGSVRALVNVADATDVPVELGYEAFGAVSGSGVGVVPQGFAGGLYDADTGLVRFGARDYEPMVGRWVSKDPWRFRGDGPNLYSYALGDPINFRDGTGRSATAAAAAAAAGAAVADGPLPVGDVIGICLLAGAIVYDLLTDAPAPPTKIYQYCDKVGETATHCIYECEDGFATTEPKKAHNDNCPERITRKVTR